MSEIQRRVSYFGSLSFYGSHKQFRGRSETEESVLWLWVLLVDYVSKRRQLPCPFYYLLVLLLFLRPNEPVFSGNVTLLCHASTTLPHSKITQTHNKYLTIPLHSKAQIHMHEADLGPAVQSRGLFWWSIMSVSTGNCHSHILFYYFSILLLSFGIITSWCHISTIVLLAVTLQQQYYTIHTTTPHNKQWTLASDPPCKAVAHFLQVWPNSVITPVEKAYTSFIPV